MPGTMDLGKKISPRHDQLSLIKVDDKCDKLDRRRSN